MPLNALRAFEATARHGRMVTAAAELAVTHGAVSRQVRHLEQLLGVTLLEGPKNRLALTEAGRLLVESLTPAFAQIDAALRTVADPDEGRLDVSCLGTFTMRWLIPRLHRFTAVHPRIDLHLSASHAPVDFARESYDVAIRVGRPAETPEVVAVPLFDEWVGPVLAPRLADTLRLDAPADLLAAPLIHPKTRRTAWADWARTRGLAQAIPAGAEYEHFYVMLEAATAGLGVAVAPWPFVIDDIRAGRLVAPFGFTPSGQRYAALRRQRRNRKAEQFCTWLAAEARAMPMPE